MTLAIEGAGIVYAVLANHGETLAYANIGGQAGIQGGVSCIDQHGKDAELGTRSYLHGAVFAEGGIHRRGREIATHDCFLVGIEAVGVAVHGRHNGCVCCFAFFLAHVASSLHRCYGVHEGLGHLEQLAVVGLAFHNLLEEVAYLLNESILVGNCHLVADGVDFLLKGSTQAGIEVGIVLCLVGTFLSGVLSQHVLGPLLHVLERGIECLVSLGELTQISEFQIAHGDPLLDGGQHVAVAEADGEGVVRHIHENAYGVTSRIEGAGCALLAMGGVADDFLQHILDGIVAGACQPAVHLVLSVGSGKHILEDGRQIVLVLIQINHCRVLMAVAHFIDTVGAVQGELIDAVFGQGDGLVHVETIVRPALGHIKVRIALALGSGGHACSFPRREAI